jgi:ABC-type multidrug transport system ATPase subunit
VAGGPDAGTKVKPYWGMALRSAAASPFDPRSNTIWDRAVRRTVFPKEDDVLSAARTAQIEPLVRRLGLAGRIGHRGVLVSGGERQRLAIARALLAGPPPILVFDEATSALDMATERAVLEALRDRLRSHTTVYIAHRLTAVADADLIVVLGAGGVLLEHGTHWDLLSRPQGAYRALWHANDRLLERRADSDTAAAGTAGAAGAAGADGGGAQAAAADLPDVRTLKTDDGTADTSGSTAGGSKK